MTPDASIVIPLYNNRRLTELCLDSIAAALGDRLGRSWELVLVDNGSLDDTAVLLDAWRERTTQVRFEENRAFARAVNAGVEAASGEIVVILNNDMEIPPGALEALAEEARDPSIGLVGARLVYPSGYVQHGGCAFRTWANGKVGVFHLFHHEPAEVPAARASYDVDGVTGACMALRRDLFRELGGFDEAFVMDLDDIDLSLRIRARGLRVRYRGDICIVHHEGATRSTSNRANHEHFHRRWEELLVPDDDLLHELFAARIDPRANDESLNPGRRAEISVEGMVTGIAPEADEARALLAGLDALGIEAAARDHSLPLQIADLDAETDALLHAARARPRRDGALVLEVSRPEAFHHTGTPTVLRLAAVPERRRRLASPFAVWAPDETAARALAAAGFPDDRISVLRAVPASAWPRARAAAGSWPSFPRTSRGSRRPRPVPWPPWRASTSCAWRSRWPRPSFARPRPAGRRAPRCCRGRCASTTWPARRARPTPSWCSTPTTASSAASWPPPAPARRSSPARAVRPRASSAPRSPPAPMPRAWPPCAPPWRTPWPGRRTAPAAPRPSPPPAPARPGRSAWQTCSTSPARAPACAARGLPRAPEEERPAILVVSGEPPDRRARTVELRTAGLLRSLARLGHAPTLLCSDAKLRDDVAEELWEDGVEVCFGDRAGLDRRGLLQRRFRAVVFPELATAAAMARARPALVPRHPDRGRRRQRAVSAAGRARGLRGHRGGSRRRGGRSHERARGAAVRRSRPRPRRGPPDAHDRAPPGSAGGRPGLGAGRRRGGAGGGPARRGAAGRLVAARERLHRPGPVPGRAAGAAPARLRRAGGPGRPRADPRPGVHGPRVGHRAARLRTPTWPGSSRPSGPPWRRPRSTAAAARASAPRWPTGSR